MIAQQDPSNFTVAKPCSNASSHPVVIIFLISSWYLISQYNINTNLKDLKYKFSIALDLVNLSKELDKEMIIMDPISKELNRKITDRTIEHIKRLHHNKMNLSNILNELNSLTQIRHTLDDPNFNKSEISSYFRDINSLIKDEILKLRNYDISHRLNLFIFNLEEISSSIFLSLRIHIYN